MIWEPLLKLGAKPGESWTWKQQSGGDKQYTFVAIEAHQGHPAVRIQSVVLGTAGVELMTNHLYVKDIGEVDRTTSVEKGEESVTIGEMKRVED